MNCDDGSTVTYLYSGFGTATDNSCSVANALSESRAYADLEIKHTQQAAAARTRCPLTPH